MRVIIPRRGTEDEHNYKICPEAQRINYHSKCEQPFCVFCFVCLFVCLFVGDLMICVSNRYRRILNV